MKSNGHFAAGSIQEMQGQISKHGSALEVHGSQILMLEQMAIHGSSGPVAASGYAAPAFGHTERAQGCFRSDGFDGSGDSWQNTRDATGASDRCTVGATGTPLGGPRPLPIHTPPPGARPASAERPAGLDGDGTGRRPGKLLL